MASSHIPRKRFGQNFLQDQSVINDIINSVSPKKGDVLVEIGPGLAALTMPLMDRTDTLHVVEIDRDIVAHLSEKFSPEKLVIHNVDALNFDFGALAAEIAPGSKIRLIGNLPYNISTPLLFHLASFGESIFDMHFMLQKEVVDRMVAEPSTSDYGRLSIMLQYRFNMERVFDVPPEAFFPPPKVDSSIVRMVPWAELPSMASSYAHLQKLVAQSFGQRRKTLRNNVKGIATDAELEALAIPPGCRPENVTLAQYVALSNYLVAAGR